MEPPTDNGLTVMVTTEELAVLQLGPLTITARYCVVAVRLVYVWVVEVFVISDQVLPSNDDCHLDTAPVKPATVMLPELLPEQTVAFEDVVPPTAAGAIVILATEELAEGQTPLCTTERIQVSVLRLI